MLSESEFVRRLRELYSERVRGFDEARKREIVQGLLDECSTANSGASLAECAWVPFVTGRRPADEGEDPRSRGRR